MNFVIACYAAPTKRQCELIRDLIKRTMKKANKPFYSHMLRVFGPKNIPAFEDLSHVGCNVTYDLQKQSAKYAIVVGAPASVLCSKTMQVLVCPED